MDGLDYYDSYELFEAHMLVYDICPECQGSGEVPDIERICKGWVRAKEPCIYCEGSGRHPDNYKKDK